MASSLTEATLHESVVTLTLNGRVYAPVRAMRDAVKVSGVRGVTAESFNVNRVSDTEVTVKLEFNGNIDADASLTFSVGTDAIEGYSGLALTAQLSGHRVHGIGSSLDPVSINGSNAGGQRCDTHTQRLHLRALYL